MMAGDVEWFGRRILKAVEFLLSFLPFTQPNHTVPWPSTTDGIGK